MFKIKHALENCSSSIKIYVPKDSAVSECSVGKKCSVGKRVFLKLWSYEYRYIEFLMLEQTK